MRGFKGRGWVAALVGATLALGTVGMEVVAASGARHPFADNRAWVAYQTFRDGHEGIWLVHPDGTGDHELDTGLPVVGLLPDWSPDGTRLAFTTRGGESEPLYQYDLSAGTATQLFDCAWPCVGDDEPAYSPDGRRIAFVRASGPFSDAGPADCSLFVGVIATGEVQRLTDNDGCDREYFPRWSPDGARLTYHRELYGDDGSVTTAVYSIAADGTDERRLTDPALVAGAPDWSPDGRWIVFSTYPLTVFQGDGTSELYRMRPDGSGLEQLTDFAQVDATQPRYTPDGEWIVFTADNRTGRKLWAVPAEGGKRVVIADRERIYTHGTWQPGVPAN